LVTSWKLNSVSKSVGSGLGRPFDAEFGVKFRFFFPFDARSELEMSALKKSCRTSLGNDTTSTY